MKEKNSVADPSPILETKSWFFTHPGSRFSDP